MPLPIGREAKSAPGRPFHVDAGSLCQHPLAYLQQWLFAFGEAPEGWGLGRPERRSLGAARALPQQPSASALAPVGRRRGPKWLRPAKDAQSTAATGPWGLDPSRVAYFAYRLGSLDLLCPQTLVGSGVWMGLPSWPLSSCAPSQLSVI